MFRSLDFVYVPTADVDAAARRYVEGLGAKMVWKVRGMDTVVACLRVSDEGPSILLSGHLEGENPILIYRVDDYQAAVAALRVSDVIVGGPLRVLFSGIQLVTVPEAVAAVGRT